MVLFRVRRARLARLDDKRWQRSLEIPIRPQQSDPSELLLWEHYATPRKSMLRGAKLCHNIYLPIPQPLKRAQGSTKNSSGMRIALLPTLGYPRTAKRASTGREFFCLT